MNMVYFLSLLWPKYNENGLVWIITHGKTCDATARNLGSILTDDLHILVQRSLR